MLLNKNSKLRKALFTPLALLLACIMAFGGLASTIVFATSESEDGLIRPTLTRDDFDYTIDENGEPVFFIKQSSIEGIPGEFAVIQAKVIDENGVEGWNVDWVYTPPEVIAPVLTPVPTPEASVTPEVSLLPADGTVDVTPGVEDDSGETSDSDESSGSDESSDSGESTDSGETTDSGDSGEDSSSEEPAQADGEDAKAFVLNPVMLSLSGQSVVRTSDDGLEFDGEEEEEFAEASGSVFFPVTIFGAGLPEGSYGKNFFTVAVENATNGKRTVESGSIYTIKVSVSMLDEGYTGAQVVLTLPEYTDFDYIRANYRTILEEATNYGHKDNIFDIDYATAKYEDHFNENDRIVTLPLKDGIDPSKVPYAVISFKYTNGITPNGYEGLIEARGDYTLNGTALLMENRTQSDGKGGFTQTPTIPVVIATANQEWIVEKNKVQSSLYSKIWPDQPTDQGVIIYEVKVLSDRDENAGSDLEHGYLYLTSLTVSDTLSLVKNPLHPSPDANIVKVWRASADGAEQRYDDITNVVTIKNGKSFSYTLNETISSYQTFYVGVTYNNEDFVANYDANIETPKSIINNSATINFKQPGNASGSDTDDADPTEVGSMSGSTVLKVIKNYHYSASDKGALTSGVIARLGLATPEFTLTKTGFTETKPVGADGTIVFSNLTANSTYTLTETKGMDGFSTGNAITFDVNGKGMIVNVRDVSDTDGYVASGTELTFTANNINRSLAEIEVIKVFKDYTPGGGSKVTTKDQTEDVQVAVTHVATGKVYDLTLKAPNYKGSVKVDGLGDYTVKETNVIAGYESEGVRTVTVAAGEKKTATLNNNSNQGSVQIVKKIVKLEATATGFKPVVVDATAAQLNEFSFTVGDNASVKAGDSFGLPAGTYAISENAIGGKYTALPALTQSTRGTVANGAATVEVKPGEHTVVTFYNFEGLGDGGVNTVGLLKITKMVEPVTTESFTIATKQGSAQINNATDYKNNAPKFWIISSGNYTVEETLSSSLNKKYTAPAAQNATVPAGMFSADQFELNADGSVKYNGTVEPVSVTVTNKLNPYVTIEKYGVTLDATGKIVTTGTTKLTNGKYTIYPLTDGGTRGTALYSNRTFAASDKIYLPVGKYELVETTAPTGYSKNNGSIAFEGTPNSTVTNAKEYKFEIKAEDIKAGASSANITLKVYNPELPKLVVKKIDAVRAQETLIDSVKFKLVHVPETDESKFKDVEKTTSNGIVTFEKLEDGTYNLYETATPINYMPVDGTKPFATVVVKYGIVTVTQNTADTDDVWKSFDAATSSTLATVTAKNEPNDTLRVIKYGYSMAKIKNAADTTYDVPLEGTSFTVKNLATNENVRAVNKGDGSYDYSATGTKTDVFVTGHDGRIEIVYLPLGEYEITEVGATEGYLLSVVNTETVEVKVDGVNTATFRNEEELFRVRVEKFGYNDKNNNGIYDGEDTLNGIADAVDGRFAIFENRADAEALARAVLGEETTDYSALLANALSTVITGTEIADGGYRYTGLSEWLSGEYGTLYLVEYKSPIAMGLPSQMSGTDFVLDALITEIDPSQVDENNIVTVQRYNPTGVGPGTIQYLQVRLYKTLQTETGETPLSGIGFEIYAADQDGKFDREGAPITTLVSGTDFMLGEHGYALSTPITINMEAPEWTKLFYVKDDGATYVKFALVERATNEYYYVNSPDGKSVVNGVGYIEVMVKTSEDKFVNGVVINQDMAQKADNQHFVNGRDAGYFAIRKDLASYKDGTSKETITQLANVKFALYTDKDGKNPVYGQDGKPVILVTDANGIAVSPTLNKKLTYYLIEDVTSIGENINPLTAAIEIKPSDMADSAYAARSLVKAVNNYAYRNGLRVTKLQSDTNYNTRLEGAEFSIAPASNPTSIIQTKKTTSNGDAIFTGYFADGEYVIKEVSFDNDKYGLYPFAVTVTIKDGQISGTLKGATKLGSGSYAYPKVSSDTYRIYVPNPKKADLTVDKSWLDSFGASTTVAVEAVDFEIYLNGELFQTKTLNVGESSVTFTNLAAWGDSWTANATKNFEIKEVLSENSKYTASASITGTLALDAATGNTVVKVDNNVVTKVDFTNTSIYGELEVTKTGMNKAAIGATALQEAKFDLYSIDGTQLTLVGELLFDGSSKFKSTEAMGLTAGKYLVVEANPPTGYDFAVDGLTEAYTLNGETLAGFEVEIAVATVNELSIEDPVAAKIAVKKIEAVDNALDQTDYPIPGAEFKLEKLTLGGYVPATDSQGNALANAETDENGIVVFENLSVGTYLITEVVAPSGFTGLTSPVEITVTNDGGTLKWNVTGVGAGNDDLVVAGQSGTANGIDAVTVKNERNSFRVYVEKTDGETGNTLSGAQFALHASTDKDASWGDNTKLTDSQGAVVTKITDGNGVANWDVSWEQLKKLGIADNTTDFYFMIEEISAPVGYPLDADVSEIKKVVNAREMNKFDANGVYVQVDIQNSHYSTQDLALRKTHAEIEGGVLGSLFEADQQATFILDDGNGDNLFVGENNMTLKDFTLTDSGIEFFSDAEETSPVAEGTYNIDEIRVGPAKADDMQVYVKLIANGTEIGTEPVSSGHTFGGLNNVTNFELIYGNVNELGAFEAAVGKNFVAAKVEIDVTFNKRESGVDVSIIRSAKNGAELSMAYGDSPKLVKDDSDSVPFEKGIDDISIVSFNKELTTRGNVKRGDVLEYRLTVKNLIIDGAYQNTPLRNPVVIDYSQKHIDLLTDAIVISLYDGNDFVKELYDSANEGNVKFDDFTQAGRSGSLPGNVGNEAALVDGTYMIWDLGKLLDNQELLPNYSIRIDYTALAQVDAELNKEYLNKAFLTSSARNLRTAESPLGVGFSAEVNGEAGSFAVQTNAMTDAFLADKGIPGEADWWVDNAYIPAQKTITLTAAGQMLISKLIRKGTEGTFAATPVTVENGGTFEYRIVVLNDNNAGSAPVTDLVVKDWLPYAGDTSLYAKRATEWDLINSGVSIVGVNAVTYVDPNGVKTPIEGELSFVSRDEVDQLNYTDVQNRFTPIDDMSKAAGFAMSFEGKQIQPEQYVEIVVTLKVSEMPDEEFVLWADKYADNHAAFISGNLPSISSVVRVRMEPYTVKVGDYAWLDLNMNGIQDEGEEPLADVTVKLYSVNGDESTLVSEMLTDENGNYLFTGLNATAYDEDENVVGDENVYRIEFEKEGYALTQARQGDDRLVDSDPSLVNGKIVTPDFTIIDRENFSFGGEILPNVVRYADLGDVDVAEADLSIDAGFIPQGRIGDYVWYDANYNGLQDDGAETGVNGVRVTLEQYADGRWSAIDATTTDAHPDTGEAGYYLFENVPFGTYRVKFDLSEKTENYRFTKLVGGGTNANNDASTVDPNGIGNTNKIATGAVIAFNVQSATLVDGIYELMTYDAGVVLPVSLGDYVWFDSNRNGKQEENESGVESIVVDLYKYAGDTQDDFDDVREFANYDLIDQTLTDETGYYLFDELDPGYYLVQFNPKNYLFTDRLKADADNDSDAITTRGDSYGFSSVVDLAIPDTHDMTIDAGLVLPRTPTPTDPTIEETVTPSPVVTTTPNPSDYIDPDTTDPNRQIDLDQDPTPFDPIFQTLTAPITPEAEVEPSRTLLLAPDSEIPYGGITPPANRFVDIIEDETPYGMAKTGEMAMDVLMYVGVGLLMAVAGIAVLFFDKKKKKTEA